MNRVANAFADELVKIGANYRVSRFLTSPGAQSVRGALGHAALGGLEWGVFGGLGGAVKRLAVAGTAGVAGVRGGLGGIGRALAERRNISQSTLARILRGGEGLMNNEKARLAEAIGVTPARMDQIIAGVARKRNAEDFMTPLESVQSRFTTASAFPHKAIDRFIGARALAGRVAEGEPLLQSETQLLKLLHRERRIQKLQRLIPFMGAAAATTGAAVGAHRLATSEGDVTI